MKSMSKFVMDKNKPRSLVSTELVGFLNLEAGFNVLARDSIKDRSHGFLFSK